jgi:hypothetical protein
MIHYLGGLGLAGHVANLGEGRNALKCNINLHASLKVDILSTLILHYNII